MGRAQALIDPVCFMTCFPHLLYNFVYKVPGWADVLSGGLEGIMGAARFIFSRDLIISEVTADPLALECRQAVQNRQRAELLTCVGAGQCNDVRCLVLLYA